MAGELAYPLAPGVDRVEIPLADQDHLFSVLAGDGLVDGAGLPALFGRHLGEQRLDGELARGVATGIEAVELPLPGPDQIPLAGGTEAAHRVTLEAGELAILAAGQIPLPYVEIAAALAQVVELFALLIPDRIAGGNPVFGQLAMLFAVEQPEPGDGERVLMLAKRLIHARHLVGQLVAVRAGQGGRQGLGRRQRAAGDRCPVEVAGPIPLRHEVIGVGVGQALAAQQQLFAVGAEGLGQIGARVAGQPHHLAAATRHHEHVLVAVEVGGKGYELAIRRPERALAQIAAVGEGHGAATIPRAQVDAALPGEGKLLAVRGEGGLAQPERLGRLQGGADQQEQQGESVSHREVPER